MASVKLSLPKRMIPGGETFVVVARFLCDEARTIEVLGGLWCTVNNRTIHADFDQLFEGELAAGESEMELVFTAPHGPVSSSGKHVNVHWEVRVDYRGAGLAARNVVELFTLVPGEKLTDDLVLADHSLQPSSSSDRKRESNWKAAMAVTAVAAMVFLISYLTVKSAVALVPAAITGGVIAAGLAWAAKSRTRRIQTTLGGLSATVESREYFQGETVFVQLRSDRPISASAVIEARLRVEEIGRTQETAGRRLIHSSTESSLVQSGDAAHGGIEIELPRGLPDSVRSEAGEIRWAIEVVADIAHRQVRICELPLEVYATSSGSIESEKADSPVA